MSPDNALDGSADLSASEAETSMIQLDAATVPGDAAAGAGGVVGTAPPVPDGYKLDVLFIVGKTRSMGDVQRRLSAAAPTFLAELQRRNLRDVRIGVGTSDRGIDGTFMPLLGTDCSGSGGDVGRLPTAATCLGPGAEFLHLRAESVTPAVNPGMALSCLLRVGTNGCVFSQPLRNFWTLWLVDRGTEFMRYFFRDDADLLLVIVSDEDDCSMALTSTMGTMGPGYFDYFPGQFRRFRCARYGHMCNVMALEPREQSYPLSACRDRWGGGDVLMMVEDTFVPRLEEIRQWKREGRERLRDLNAPRVPLPEPRVMIAALSGWPSEQELPTARYEWKYFTSEVTGESLLDVAPVCGQGAGEARPGLRLRTLAGALPAGDGLFLSVCGEDLRPALVQVAGLPGPGVARQ